MKLTLRKKSPYSEIFWSVFSHIRTNYGEIRTISPYSVRMRENADQKYSEYGHSSRIISSCDKQSSAKRYNLKEHQRLPFWSMGSFYFFVVENKSFTILNHFVKLTKRKHNPRMTIYVIRSFLQVGFRFQYQLVNPVWLSFHFFSFS